jgi:hypothetical protein
MSSWLSGLGGGGGSSSDGTFPTADNPNAIPPGYAADTYTPTSSGVSWADVQKAAKTLSDVGDASKQPQVQNLPGAGLPAMARPNTGVPAHAGALTALLQMLNQRRDSYLNAATNPRAGAVQQGPPAAGLLGV